MSVLVLRPAAVEDVKAGAEWYEAEEAGLGGSFLDEIRSTLDRVCASPRQFPEVVRGARRALVRRFPYAVYFLVREVEKTVVVVAVLHQQRAPSRWRGRIKRG
jgi:plasmid stabilization system protein ParE